MTFWIIAAGLTGLTCLALLAALGGGGAPASPETNGHDRRFYAAQLAEIDRQASLGLMGPSEAEAARTEAARRLLAAADAPAAQTSGGGRRLAAIAVLIATPAIAIPAYLARGAPDVPGFPLASRQKEAPTPGGGIDVASAVGQIEAHLQKNPEDARGHEVIAPIYLRTGRAADAARAFGVVLRLRGPSADRHADLGEALTAEADGVVTAEAKSAFAAALALDEKHVKARYYTALAAQQDGDREMALRLLTALRDDLPEGQLKGEIAGQVAALAGVPKGGETVAALPRDDQQKVIRDMVEGLAQRLATTGGSADEWARLIRALTVLGERERAGAILTEARQKFAANATELTLIENAAKGAP